jgi:hypothetical protein
VNTWALICLVPLVLVVGGTIWLFVWMSRTTP